MLILTAISAVAATITVFISWMTYKSQKATQENTRSLVQPMYAIKHYMINCFLKFIYYEIFLYYVSNKLKKCKTGITISSYLLSGLKFDLNDFYSNLFYEDEDTYQYLSQFKSALLAMNQAVSGIENESNNCSNDQIQRYLNEMKSRLLIVYPIWHILLRTALIIEKIGDKANKVEKLSKEEKEEQINKRSQRLFEYTIFKQIEQLIDFCSGKLNSKEDKHFLDSLKEIKTLIQSSYQVNIKDVEKLIKEDIQVDYNFYFLDYLENEKKKAITKRFLDIMLLSYRNEFNEMIFEE